MAWPRFTLAAFIFLACSSPAIFAAESAPDFNRDVAPLLRKYCAGCHGADDPEKGLVLDSYAGIFKGGERGAVVVAGASDRSRLLLVLDGRAKPAMPPEDNEKPSPKDLAILKSWIDAGAKGPSGAEPDPTVLITPQIKPRAAVQPSITAAAISPDGTLLALAGYQEVRLIDRESRALVRRIAGLRGNVAALAFSRDGKLLATAGGEPGLIGEARLWRVADGAMQKIFRGHKDSLYAVAISPDGKLLATGSYDQQIKLWDATTGKELRTVTGHNGAIFDLAFHPSGKILASASADRTVKLWLAATGQRLDTLSQPLKDVYCVAFSPDGKTLVSGSVDSRIRIYRVSDTAAENTNPLVVARYAHEGAVLKLAFSADGKTLATSGEDRAVRLWNTTDYTERDSLEQQSDWAPALAIAPDSKSLAVGRLDGTFALYDTMSGELIRPAKPELSRVEPRGVMRGVATKIKLSGKNLLGATQLKFAGASPQSFAVRLLPADPARPNQLLAEVTPAATLARGNYSFTVSTAGGTSTGLSLYVDDLPQVVEAEPSNVYNQAPTVKLPFTAWGAIAARGNRDHYRFDAKAGQTLVFELSAKRSGSTLNGLLTLLDPAGEVVASNNDFDNQNDPLIAYKIPTDGRYTIRVQDFTLTGLASHFYRLSAGELTYVTGVFPLSVPVGRETTLELAGYNLPADTRVSVHPQQPGETMVALDTNRFRSGQPLKVEATADNELVEREPNNLPPQATPLTTPAYVGGRLWSRSEIADVDLYRFKSRQGQTWSIDTSAARRGSPADTKIEVLDAQGRPVERLLLQAVRDSYVTFRPISSRESAVRVFNWQEMELNQLMYMQGEVCKIFRMPEGPDSGFAFYAAGGMRRDYFDTTATAHAMDEPCYIVEPHKPGEKLIPNGLPTFPLYYANDDDAERKLGSDSRLLFTAPADGDYLVRVSDVRGFGGDRFAYRLTVRPAQPGYKVTLSNRAPTVNAASGVGLVFRVDRLDGFDDDIAIEIAGVPPGYSIAGPVVIQAGHLDARAVLNALPDAMALKAADWQKVRFAAHAKSSGAASKEGASKEAAPQEVAGFTAVKLAAKPKLIVKLEPAELTIAPGQTISATLKVERNGFNERVPFNVLNLPHGVIVDNIGLSGILVRENETERQIFLTAANWVPETDRYIYAENSSARGAANGGQASRPQLLHVRPSGKMASAK